MVQGLTRGLLTLLRRAARLDVNANGPPPPPPIPPRNGRRLPGFASPPPPPRNGRRLLGFASLLVWALVIGILVGLGIPIYYPSSLDVLKRFPGMRSLAQQENTCDDMPPGGGGAGAPSGRNETCDAAHSTMPPYSLGLLVLALLVVAQVNLAPRDEEHGGDEELDEDTVLRVEDTPADDQELLDAPRGNGNIELTGIVVEDPPATPIHPDPHMTAAGQEGAEDTPADDQERLDAPRENGNIELSGIVVEDPPAAPIHPDPHMTAAGQEGAEDPPTDPSRPAPRPHAGRIRRFVRRLFCCGQTT